MGKLLQKIDLGANSLCLSECTDGFWLWDETREMNLSMKAKTERVALVETILYYQRRLAEVETDRDAMRARIDDVLNALGAEETENDNG